ncbi:MAG TPA: DUF4157 domain-containing protein, partial [Blastocatellia bacterium]|nr:DUF4157 domain-containing protein [Blastocatellia bacterium]
MNAVRAQELSGTTTHQNHAQPPLQQPSPAKGSVVGIPLFLIPQLQRAKSTIAESGSRGVPSAFFANHQNKEGAETNAIRLYDNAASHQAAHELGAYGYSWRGDIFLGAGLGMQGRPGRAEVIQHELRHAKQARNPFPAASEAALEREAHSSLTTEPSLAADPNQVLGLWWIIPVAVGAYI